MKQLIYLDKIINVILGIYNISSNIVFALRNIFIRNILINNKKLKTKNKACFIIGNGPSLKNIDLNKLEKHHTITVNFFHQNEQYKNFESTCHIMIDSVFYNGKELEYLTDIYQRKTKTKFIFKINYYNKLKSLLELDRSYFIYPKLWQYGDEISINMEKNMTASINVVICAIQNAIYMGYKEIYLLGCDFNDYTSHLSMHFYGNSVKDIIKGDELRGFSLAYYHHYALQKYCIKHNILIKNLTKGSMLDAYPFDDLDEILPRLNKT